MGHRLAEAGSAVNGYRRANPWELNVEDALQRLGFERRFGLNDARQRRPSRIASLKPGSPANLPAICSHQGLVSSAMASMLRRKSATSSSRAQTRFSSPLSLMASSKA